MKPYRKLYRRTTVLFSDALKSYSFLSPTVPWPRRGRWIHGPAHGARGGSAVSSGEPAVDFVIAEHGMCVFTLVIRP